MTHDIISFIPSFVLYTMFIVEAYQTSMELLSMWCRAAAFVSASGGARSQEVPTVK
jgi:hypothetical protein